MTSFPAQQFFGNATGNFSLPSGNEARTSGGPDVVSLLTLLFSFSPSRDWLKLVIIGGIFESFRSFLMIGYYKFVDSFFIRASFDCDDPSYHWILVWLSRQPSWSKTRDMQITTRGYGHGATSPAVVLEGEDHYSTLHYFFSSRKIAYLPSASMTYSLWFKRRWMTITRSQESVGIHGEKENTLRISILTRSHKILTELLQEARQFYMAGQEHKMCIFVSDSSNRWNSIGCRENRSINSIVLDPGVKDALLEDARDFLRSKSWYAERGIPFRRGYLLYGVPASGKTSIIHCMAGELKLDVYIISLSRAGMDDATLSELVNALPERCIALMEDIDAAFTHGVSRNDMSELDDDDEKDQKKLNQKQTPTTTSTPVPNRLSLSGLLNALDGVGAQEGRILFATTNRYSALDKALCRPGRMDLHIEFKNASKYQARELFSRFYLPSPAKGEEIYASREPSNVSGLSDEKSKPEESTATPAIDLSLFTGETHTRRTPSLTPECVAELAERFADAIPERECSVASLQGYLMSYKTRPVEAVERAPEWFEKEVELKKGQEEELEKDKLKKKELRAENEVKKKEGNKEQTTEITSTG
ncbi:hypothetical protein E4T56_gene2122, partial [Termitomyces sp. T112]